MSAFVDEVMLSLSDPARLRDLVAPATRAIVDHARFIYFVDASFTGGTTSNLVQITALQITYVAE